MRGWQRPSEKKKENRKTETREERIKKLKKKRIWPSVLGLIFILFVFSIVMLAALGLSGMDIVRQKLTDSSRVSVKVAEVFGGYSEENKEIIEQTVVSHINVLDEIEAVAVVGPDGQFLWSSNGEYPVLDNTIKMELLPGLMEEEIRVIIAEQQDQVFIIEDGEIVFNENAVANEALDGCSCGRPGGIGTEYYTGLFSGFPDDGNLYCALRSVD